MTNIPLGQEWMIRIATGVLMIPLALLVTGAIAAFLPENSESFAIVAGALFYLIASMVVSMIMVQRKAKP
jgi:hypothetical protein